MKTKETTTDIAATEYCELVKQHRTTPLTIDDIKEAFLSGAGFQRMEDLLNGILKPYENFGMEASPKNKKFTDFGDA